jgi:hypothetical protein
MWVSHAGGRRRDAVGSCVEAYRCSPCKESGTGLGAGSGQQERVRSTAAHPPFSTHPSTPPCPPDLKRHHHPPSLFHA